MNKFRYNIPSEFTDEDRWFKYFTKKDLLVIVVTGILTGVLFKLSASLINKPYVGLIIGLIIMGASLFCCMVRKPETLYLTGGGQTLATIILRRLIRRKNRVIYVRGYNEQEDE